MKLKMNDFQLRDRWCFTLNLGVLKHGGIPPLLLQDPLLWTMAQKFLLKVQSLKIYLLTRKHLQLRKEMSVLISSISFILSKTFRIEES